MDQFAVVIFPDEAKAAEGSRVLRELDMEGAVDLYELAVIHEDPQGRSAVASQSVPSAALGGLAGGLLGLLGGPVGLAVGAASGAWIGTLRDLSKLGDQTDFAERLRRELAPGKAALVAELEERDRGALERRMEDLDGVVVLGSAEDEEESDLAQRAALLKADLETPPANGSAPRAEIDELRKRVLAARERVQSSTAQRIARLEQDADGSTGQDRAAIERRIVAARARAERRTASLERTLALLDAAEQIA